MGGQVFCYRIKECQRCKFFINVWKQAENVLMLAMDMPTRTTRDYQEPVIDPKTAAALEDALREEKEIQVDASDHSSLGAAFSSGSLKKPKSG